MRLSLLLALVLLLAAPPARAQETVRIRVLERHAPSAVLVRAVGAPSDVYLGTFPNPVGRVAAGATATVTLDEGEVGVRLAEGEVVGLSFRIVPARGGRLEVDVREGRSLDAPRLYEGPLAVDADGDALRLVTTAELETYVASVLPHEYGFDDLEGTKAMAVVIRTYALRPKHGADTGYDHTDDVNSQVFRGVGGITEVARRAVEATRGEIVTYQGEPIDAVYHSSSGGHTANNDDVWQGGPLPYVRGKPDPYEASPHAEWESRVERDRLLDILSDEAGEPVTGFFVGDRSRDGRVTTVDLRLGSGERRPTAGFQFRALIGRRLGPHALKSTLFDARRDGDAYVFTGRGYGHGVGLSQWGAHEMARRGHSYRDILGFYYTGVSLGTLDGTLLTTLDAAAPGPPTPTERSVTPSGRRIGW